MKKHLLSIMTLMLLCVSNIYATQIEVTMNAKSKLIKSFVNMATSESVAVGEPTSNKYTFDAADGSYLLTATAADGETVSGTIQVDVDADHTSFAIFSPEITVKNTGWEYGTDYTFNLKVTTKEGAEVNTAMGEYTTGKKMFMVFSGNTYYLDLVPSEARLAEGYLPTTYTGTVTFNASVSAEAPMSAAYSISVPAGADLFLGTKTQIDDNLWRRLQFWRQQQKVTKNSGYEDYVNACVHMSQTKTGALIIFKRQNSVDELVDTGELVDALASSALIETIFFKTSPLHDGAMIVNGNHIIAARCILPVTSRLDIDPNLGLRHRSAIGVTEQLDVLSVIVSEETGAISYALNGEIHHDISPVELRQVLEKYNC
jgi:DNA integrity scanning protein DisA with diadenylate cyclase activity